MTVVKSSWINFLRQYGPIPRNDNMYDETIQRTIKKKNINPVQIDSEHTETLISNFKSDVPNSVILTGTAGDGKTYHCREVWSALGGDMNEWSHDKKVKELILPNQKKLSVIKDLSELMDEERDVLYKFFNSVMDSESNEVFLIAANDGQLIEAWKYLEPDIHSETVKKCVEELLVNELHEKKGFNLLLFNLSQINAATLFRKIADVVLDHSGWEECNSCSLRDNLDYSNRCPIWENRKRLQGKEDNKLIQSRMIDLLELCELNGVHLPIRQILLLVSNMLLGHPHAKDKLMNCTEVTKVLDLGLSAQASIYRNTFGENLSDRRRESTDVFSVLGRFGVGNETSNTLDNILIYGADDVELKPYYQELVLNDSYYGADDLFKAHQNDYLEGRFKDNDEEIKFLNSLKSQRQRLFFVIPNDKIDELKMWQLTTFRYSGEFLNEVFRQVKNGDKVSTQLISRLAQGLNRIFTGLLTKTYDEIILASSGSHSQAKVSRIFEESISVPKKRGESLTIKINEKNKLVLAVTLSSNQEVGSVELPLQLIRYEFLSRVAEGALPGSFSRECYEDILGFKSRLLKKVDNRKEIEQDESDDESDLIFNIIRLNNEGKIEKRTVEVSY